MRNLSARLGSRTLRSLSIAIAVFLGVSTGCRPDDVVEDPVVLGDASAFAFPLELWDRGVEGEAVVRLRVTAAGVVDRAVIHESSGEAAFDEAALAGALELRFDPARQGDQPIEAWVRLPVRFTRAGESGGAEAGSPELTDGDRPQAPAGVDGDAAADSSSTTALPERRSGS